MLKSMLSVVALASVAAAPAGPKPADAVAIRSFLTRVYNSYRECVVRPGAVHDRCVEPVNWNSIFTPATKRLIDRDSPEGEATAANDADPICGCQDYGTFHVTGIDLAGQPDGRVRAKVSWAESFKAMRTQQRHRTLVLQRTPAGWRVYDVLDDGGYRKMIIDELRGSH